MDFIFNMKSTEFIKTLEKFFPSERFKTRSIDLYAYASDAGFYEILPIAVCFPNSESEIQEILKQCVNYDIPLTFRAGGTSLSGQTVGEGLIVDLSRAWKKVELLDQEDTFSVKVQPGVTGGIVNQYLKTKNRKIGPDPSSINSAMMGGILSNNASGMCCGVTYNSYHTLQSIRFILFDGKIYDTSIEEDYKRFENEQIKLFSTLQNLQNKIVNNDTLTQIIREKYKIKNTVGYGINSFLDYKHPLDIFAHLLIGAEGTLAFISEAVLKTLADKPLKATALLVFDTIGQACDAIIPLKNLGAEALELMDRASLKSVENMKGIPSCVKDLPETASALLCEFQAFSTTELNDYIANATNLNLQLLQKLEFTQDANEQALLWKIRKGMFPAVGAVRAKGTTVVLEDIAFPLENLSAAVSDLQKLFEKYNYSNAIIFGHAKDGNLHFVITQGFDTDEQIQRYAQFMEEVVALVVHTYKGSLKAEHGTGRNMAPFVKTEWGAEAYEIMCELKNVADPFGVFNKGVIINNDDLVHLKNLKKTPVVEEEVDKCIECGFCEQACPSKSLTLSPRKRIVIRRAQQRLLQAGKSQLATELGLYYHYDGLKTCAVDGMCAVDCPVEINTGNLVKQLRAKENSFSDVLVANWVAKNLVLSEKSLRLGFNVFKKSRAFSKSLGLFKNIPDHILPANFETISSPKPQFVVFTSCVSRLMTNQNIHDTSHLSYIAEKLGFELKILPMNNGLCCGQAFSSKGFEQASETVKKNTVEQLLDISEGGKLPILVDVSSCSQNFLSYKFSDFEDQKKYNQLQFLDSVDFVHDYILPKLLLQDKLESVTIHPNCSLQKMNKLPKYKKIIETIAHQVHIPKYATCCGMAGDRGFIVPELTESAVQMQASEVNDFNSKHHCSTSVTCNVNLSMQTGKKYESLYALIHQLV